MTLIGNAAFHSLRNQFLGILLEITVFAAVFHGRQRAHTAVCLVFAALIEFELARAFITSGEDTAHHTDIGTRSKRFGHITGILDTAVRDNRDA